jgi:hypothetical protein
VIAHELLAGRRLFVGENDAATIRTRNYRSPRRRRRARRSQDPTTS